MEKAQKMIPLELYRTIAENMPIMCVDAVIVKDGKYLLVKRNNEPLKGKYWTPGGRVHKGENLTKALIRKVKEETGLIVKPISVVGFYEDFYEKNAVGVKQSHTVSIVFSASYVSGKVKLDSQSNGYKWSEKLPKELNLQMMFI